jgi:dTDP-4-dehydrorhamnose reductase
MSAGLSGNMGPRILILGASGQLGSELQRSFAGFGEIAACDRATAELSNPGQLRNTVRDAAPDVILNAAAYTAVDRAEAEPDLAMAVNAQASEILAEEAARCGALLVHYSTDYVFDGTKAGAWTETDATHPLNVYGASKLAGEEAIARIGGRFLIFRTSWVYGPHGKNFLFTMLRLGRERKELSVVDDQVGAPTTSIELANATRTIVEGIAADRFDAAESWSGIYHMTCGGAVSWCGFARGIFERAGPLLEGKMPDVRPIPTSAYPTPARRPQNSVLSNHKLESRFGVHLAPWQAALDRVIHRLIEERPRS